MRPLHFPPPPALGARARPFKRSPLFFFFSLPHTLRCFCSLSALCTSSLVCARFSPPPPPPPPPLAALMLPYCMDFSCSRPGLCLSASVSLALPPVSRVISLSYVCPSLYVCVPPLFVSDSFSREIRDAYLVPLSSTGAVAVSYTARRWPRCQKLPPLIMCSSYPDRCQVPGAGGKPWPSRWSPRLRLHRADWLIDLS